MAAALAAAATAAAQTIVPTAEGQVGEAPAPDTKVVGARFESIRGEPGEILLGGIFSSGGLLPPPPEASFFTDRVHSTPTPAETFSETVSFDNVVKVPPSSARSRNAADDGDFVAFSFAVDGSLPQTMAVRIVTFDETGSKLADVALDNIDTFPDPSFNDTDIAVDDQGRVTVVYTEITQFTPGLQAEVKAQRLDVATGSLLGAPFTVAADRTNVGVALLDPAGDRLVIPTSDFATIRGNVVDTTGVVPVVEPEFQISTTPGIANINPVVAADPSTGAFTVAWENIVDLPGDPVNVRARRFDAMGNPVGDDFVVNTTTADAQGQPDVAKGPNGETVVVWASDPHAGGDALDVFSQAYDAAGNPIGGEIRVNTEVTGGQDKPAVRFLPEPDALGRSSYLVLWRDVGVSADDGPANGTGQSYKCNAIDPMPEAIFADGFEDGDTSSWSTRRP